MATSKRRKTAAKPRPRKRAAVKPKPRKRAAGIGHNKPPSEVPRPARPHTSSHLDETAAQVARDAATHRRRFRAATGSGTSLPLAHDPSVLHTAMLKRIAALEETTAKLPPASAGPRPLDDNDIAEIEREIARLKALPPVPAKPPTDAQNKLRAFGEKVLQSLAEDAAKRLISEAAKQLWAEYGDRLIALAQSIGELIASLPPPPM
jgi:hypothetical protein